MCYLNIEKTWNKIWINSSWEISIFVIELIIRVAWNCSFTLLRILCQPPPTNAPVSQSVSTSISSCCSSDSKNLGTNISFPKPVLGSHTLYIAIFSDAGRLSDHRQLPYISGLLIWSLALNYVFHTVSWMLHKSKRPVKSISAAEILVASEPINEGNVLQSTLSTLTETPVRLVIILDSNDVYK